MTATEKHFPPYIDSENTDADTQGNAESWVTPDRALRFYRGASDEGAPLVFEHVIGLPLSPRR